jgi:signal transduction histidine kinase
LTTPARMTDNSDVTKTGTGGLDDARREVAELRASRERLVLAADAESHRTERALHEGVQQHLVALAVSLQLASRMVEADPAAAKALLETMEGDVRDALVEAAQLAQRIHQPLLEQGLGVALRAAVSSLGVRATVDVAAGDRYPEPVARSIYLCCVEVLESAVADAHVTVTVRHDADEVAFEVCLGGALPGSLELDGMQDRIEALGGRLTGADQTDGARVSGALPLTRWR